MKIKLLTLVALLGIFIGCKEDDPEPLAIEKMTVMLAGKKGESKTWKLESGSLSVNGGANQTLNFVACFTDNLYEFSNNDSQDYEGASKCETTDPTITEYGNWALTFEGELIIFAAIDILSNNFSFGNLTCEIVTLTAEELSISFEFEDNEGDNLEYTLGFEAQ